MTVLAVTVSIVSLCVAGMALTINFLTFRDRRGQDRRDLFLAMHERMVAPELQHGRRLLFERIDTVDDAVRLRTEDRDAYQAINRALSMMDIFAMYVQRGYIDRQLALEEWGQPFARAFDRAAPFIEERGRELTWTPWPHLHAFGTQCREWHDLRGGAYAPRGPSDDGADLRDDG